MLCDAPPCYQGTAVRRALSLNRRVTVCRCKPKKCRQECKKSCPVVKIGAAELKCMPSLQWLKWYEGSG